MASGIALGTAGISESLSAVMAEGYKKIPNVYIARKVKAYSRPKAHWGIYLILFSQWPIFLDFVLYFIYPHWAAIKGYAMLWFIGFGLSVALMLTAAETTWTFATERAKVLDDLISDPSDYQIIIDWLRKYMARRRQLILPVLAAIGAPIFLYLVRNQLQRTVGLGLPSYFLVSWVGFVGGVDVYWLWVPPGLPSKLYKCQNLNLRWQDPASTPGMKLMSNGYGVSALFLLAGIITISILGFVVPRAVDAPGVLYILLGFFFLSVATSIRVAIVPFMWIWAITSRAKNAFLAIIDDKMPDLQTTASAEENVPDKWLMIYQIISAAPVLPFSTATVVQYSAAMAGSIFAFAIGLISSHVKF